VDVPTDTQVGSWNQICGDTAGTFEVNVSMTDDKGKVNKDAESIKKGVEASLSASGAGVEAKLGANYSKENS